MSPGTDRGTAPLRAGAGEMYHVAMSRTGTGCVLTAWIITAAVVAPAAAAQNPDSHSTVELKGRCVDAAGQPIPRAKVSLYQEDYDEWRIRLGGAAITDADGHFTFAGAPQPSTQKRAIVLAQVKGRAVGVHMLRAAPRDPDSLDLRLGEAATLRGTVLDSRGEPAVGATVWVARLGGAHMLEPLAELQTLTDARGGFAFEALPSGVKLDVRIHHPGHVFARIMTVTAPDSIRVDLEPGGTVLGRVVYEKTGEPGAGVVVQAQGARHPDPMRGWMSTRADDEGRFRLDCLPPGPFNIWARKAGWTVVALDSFDVGTGENRAPDLTMVRGGWIEGEVLDADTGKPMSEASVGMYGPARPRSGAAIESVRVASDGTFRIRAAPGRHYVYLCTANLSASVWVTVADGETSEVELRARKVQSRR